MEITKIGKKHLKYPIIQGGMGVGVSLGRLAGTVAKEGCMGLLSMVNIGYREDDFYKNPLEANKRAFSKELKKAREISEGNGIVGVNIMAALNDFSELVKCAVKEKVDAIVVGAGLPTNLPELVDTKEVLIAPIISSKKALDLIIRTWKKKYDRLPDFVVLEGSQAGGHLGFKDDQIGAEEYSLENLTKSVVEYLKEVKEKYSYNIPLFVGGTISGNEDFEKFRKLGATGVQVGTRFIATEECDADEAFKELIVNSTSDDIEVFRSPVGMPGRGVRNKFIERVKKERVPTTGCVRCVKRCVPAETPYCISDALINAAKGNVDEGLFFCGGDVDNINEIKTVKEVISDLVGNSL